MLLKFKNFLLAHAQDFDPEESLLKKNAFHCL